MRSGSRERPVANLKEFSETLPLTLGLATVSALLLYFAQILFKKNFFEETENTTVICEKCQKLKTEDKKYDCPCGGKYIRLTEMEWVDD